MKQVSRVVDVSQEKLKSCPGLTFMEPSVISLELFISHSELGYKPLARLVAGNAIPTAMRYPNSILLILPFPISRRRPP